MESNGSTKTWTAPCVGIFSFEAWGASGGQTSYIPGKGAYTYGKLSLDKDKTFYIYVGQQGNTINNTGTFNGGGYKGTETEDASGGGATDFRIANGIWNNVTSLRSRIMVAGAGAGADDGNTAGNNHAGTLSTNNTSYSSGITFSQSTQLAGGIASNGGVSGGFGYGNQSSSTSHCGGGSGYYGGGSTDNGGIGGSSFISGYKGAIAVKSSSDTSPRSGVTGSQCNMSSALSDISCSYHYSGYVFTDAVMKAGNEVFKSPSGANETGHSGNGYARITIIE